MTKEAFLNHLYGGMDEPEVKIIDVFICKLRKKLAQAGADNLIATVWGRGYVLREPKPRCRRDGQPLATRAAPRRRPEASGAAARPSPGRRRAGRPTGHQPASAVAPPWRRRPVGIDAALPGDRHQPSGQAQHRLRPAEIEHAVGRQLRRHRSPAPGPWSACRSRSARCGRRSRRTGRAGAGPTAGCSRSNRAIARSSGATRQRPPPAGNASPACATGRPRWTSNWVKLPSRARSSTSCDDIGADDLRPASRRAAPAPRRIMPIE